MMWFLIYVAGVLVNIVIYELWGKSNDKSYAGYIADLFFLPWWLLVFVLSWLGTLLLIIYKITS